MQTENDPRALELSEVDAQVIAWTELKEALAKQAEANSLVDKARDRVAAVQGQWFKRTVGDQGTPSRPSMRSRKPNVQVYEEILRAHGKPMYVTDIRDAAQQAGVQWKGIKNSTKIQVQHALNASGRFENVGDNTWWLAGEPVPAGQKSDGEHGTESGEVTVVGVDNLGQESFL